MSVECTQFHRLYGNVCHFRVPGLRFSTQTGKNPVKSRFWVEIVGALGSIFLKCLVFGFKIAHLGLIENPRMMRPSSMPTPELNF